jgi:hypothetical protein
MERRLKIYVDIDNTICHTQGSDYENSIPIPEHIDKINKLFDEGHEIVYWTARGQQSKHDYKMLTINQLHSWGCKYSSLVMNHKPSYDLLICDKSKRIEEI